MGEDLRRAAERELEGVIDLRRRIHAEPELGLELPRTREKVLAALSGLDLEIADCGRTSGIVATLRGAAPGPRVLLRADMDALPMPEDSGLEFASRLPGRMHACGHDAHTAMLVGAARVLARERATLAGEVKLLFQPGEEGHFGARLMLEDGVIAAGGEPDAVFALHVDPRLAVGRIASRAGPVMASADVWSIELKGRGGHASMPHNTRDPVPVACEIVTALQTMVTRRINAFDPVVLTTARIEAGTTNNVIPERASLLGTLRATSQHSRMAAEEGIHRVAQGIAAAHDIEATVHVVEGYPVTINDDGFTRFARRVGEELFGPGSWVELPSPIMGAEDFSYLLERWPGAMVFLGLRDPALEHPEPCHSNRMRIDEAGMAKGVALYAGIAMRYLEEAAS